MQNDDFQVIHEGDQERAEGLALGDLRIVGQDEAGRDLLRLTSKGLTRSLLMFLAHLLEQTDIEHRDFTVAEKQQGGEYLETLKEVLTEQS
jgi:hypothetical protein